MTNLYKQLSNSIRNRLSCKWNYNPSLLRLNHSDILFVKPEHCKYYPNGSPGHMSCIEYYRLKLFLYRGLKSLHMRLRLSLSKENYTTNANLYPSSHSTHLFPDCSFC